jgi:hypothetical protein
LRAPFAREYPLLTCTSPDSGPFNVRKVRIPHRSTAAISLPPMFSAPPIPRRQILIQRHGLIPRLRMHQRPQHRPLNRPRVPRTKSRTILGHPHTRNPRAPAPRNRLIRPTPLHLFFLARRTRDFPVAAPTRSGPRPIVGVLTVFSFPKNKKAPAISRGQRHFSTLHSIPLLHVMSREMLPCAQNNSPPLSPPTLSSILVIRHQIITPPHLKTSYFLRLTSSSPRFTLNLL